MTTEYISLLCACDEELYCNGYIVQKRVRARSQSTQSSTVCLLAVSSVVHFCSQMSLLAVCVTFCVVFSFLFSDV